jgi:protein tyrosine phosphatase (PTP) superfamily phosphohydrolase (DUF442 family)
MGIQRHFVRTSTTVFLTAFLFAPPVVRQSWSETRPASGAVDLANIRIDNFGRVNERYYRGAQPKDHDYSALAALGIKTIIDLTSDDADPRERALTDAAGMAYVAIPMTTHKPPTPAQIAEFLRIANDPASGPVYVHCVGGRHRTGVMTALYRMTHDAWSAEQAFQEMKRYKFGADYLHAEFKKFVYGYTAAATAVPAAEGASMQ